MPQRPAKEELLDKPDGKSFRQKVRQLEKKIQSLYDAKNDFWDELQKIRKDISDKNREVFDQLHELRSQRKESVLRLKVNNESKSKLYDEIRLIDDKSLKLSKGFPELKPLEDKVAKQNKQALETKTVLKDAIDDMIKAREDEFRHKQRTATEERRFIEEL